MSKAIGDFLLSAWQRANFKTINDPELQHAILTCGAPILRDGFVVGSSFTRGADGWHCTTFWLDVSEGWCVRARYVAVDGPSAECESIRDLSLNWDEFRVGDDSQDDAAEVRQMIEDWCALHLVRRSYKSTGKHSAQVEPH